MMFFLLRKRVVGFQKKDLFETGFNEDKLSVKLSGAGRRKKRNKTSRKAGELGKSDF